tara:strand:- start:14 stop:649 length:636 start_codon:yes stop_codon:yes gene_type:complete
MGIALAAGNCVVLKPAEQIPLSALHLADLFSEAGFPDGVVNIVNGFGDAGAALAEHMDVDKVAFTGSAEVGHEIVKASCGNLKRVSLELGGKSPSIVFPDADLDIAAHCVAGTIFFNQGQVFTAGSRLLIHQDVYEEVMGRVAEEIFGPAVVAASVWTKDINKAHKVEKGLKAGTVWVNCHNTFDAASPFCGYKRSGFGREMATPSKITRK